MARSLSTQDITWFLDLHERGQLNLEPSYQRRSVWSTRDKQFFVDTILNNYPAPPIFLHKTIDDKGRPTYHVVDGKQRLQTIFDFASDKIRIPDDFADTTLRRKKWSELERGSRESFWNYLVIVEMLPEVNDPYLRDIFERINRNSRKLMPQELRHAKYDGWFATTVEAEAEKQEWKDFGIATPARMKRMAEVQFVSELFQLLIHRRIEGFDQNALDDLYAEYDDLSEKATFIEDEFFIELEETKQYIRSIIAIETEIRDYLKIQAHFYTLWSYLVIERTKLLPSEIFAAKYVDFLRLVKAVIENSIAGTEQAASVNEYATNTRGASTDLTPRIKRYNALMTAIRGIEETAHEGS